MIKRIVKEVQLAAESCDGTLDKGNFWLIASIGHDLPGHKIIQAIEHTTPAFFINLVRVRGWKVLLMAVTLTAELFFLC